MTCPGPRYRAPTRELCEPGLAMSSETESIIEQLGPREGQGSFESNRNVRDMAAEIIQQRRGSD